MRCTFQTLLLLTLLYYMFTLCVAPMSCTPIGHDTTVAAYCLLLPAKTLHISALLTAKKFGNKEGAVRTIRLLELTGLGEVEEIKPQRGDTMV